MRRVRNAVLCVLLLGLPSGAFAEEFCLDRAAKAAAESGGHGHGGEGEMTCAQGKKPKGCNDCKKQTCNLIDKVEETRKIRELYRTNWIRAQAARRVLATGKRNQGMEEFECLIKEEFDKWYGVTPLACGRKKKNKKGNLQPSAQASLESCTIICMDEFRKASCDWDADATFAHESHHVEYCERKDSPYYTWNRDCAGKWRGLTDKQKAKCARDVIDDQGNEESASYDQGIAKLRRTLARMRKKCGTNTSMDDFIISVLDSGKNKKRFLKSHELLEKGRSKK